MGYFSAGFVFNTAPDWKRLDSLSKRVALRAFKHKAQPLWMLACAEQAHKDSKWPFTRFLERNRYTSEAPANALANSIVKSVTAISEDHGDIAHDALALGADIHTRVALPAYFFAADDDGLAMAFEFASGKLQRFQFRGGHGSVELKNGRISVSPEITVIDDDDEVGPDKEAVDTLRSLPLVDIGETTRVNEGEAEPRMIYDVPINQWPKGWPDPATTLGFGTWDPLLNFDQDFEPCYRR